MTIPLYLVVPFLAAGLYASASLFFKRAYANGLGTLDAFYWMNLMGLVIFTPLFLTAREWPDLTEWWKPALTASLIFGGTWTTFAAIRSGDVSLVTPLMGTKVVFTALVAAGWAGTQLPVGLWVAAVLTTVGILILGWRDLRRGQGKRRAVLLCLVSALIFASADVLIGQWARDFGRAAFLGTVFGMIGVISLIMVRWHAPHAFRVPSAARRDLALGAGLMNLNTLAMGLVIASSNDPAGVNIVYGTRGLWSIALVWFFGRRWFGNEERHSAGDTMVRRLAGSVLILAAVGAAVGGRS